MGVIEALRSRSEDLPVPELITTLLEQINYKEFLLKDGSEEGKERWNNVLELVNVASTIVVGPDEDPLTAFLERVSLVSDVDNLRDSENGVTLLTLHAAKGLEFPVVFIVGLEDGLLPHSRSIDEPDEMEEERRLFYVGITRAKDLLYLLHTFRRTRYGSSDISIPSRFLSEIPREYLENYSPGDSLAGGRHTRSPSRTGDEWPFASRGSRARSTSTPPQAGRSAGPIPRFYAGQRVRNPKFGVGTVVSVVEKDGDQEVRVAFAGKGIKLFLAKFAKLESV
jgi:DNA helicase-2/ATP-dependent DNA helicase PcrA